MLQFITYYCAYCAQSDMVQSISYMRFGAAKDLGAEIKGGNRMEG